MKFRLDINGLRAIAILGVVLFHFNHDWLSGGFAGVDVFFVISGFLMTSIVFRGLENNSFSLFEFYVHRANRIIPALAFLCFVLIVFGWFYLAPIDYRALGKHVVSSLEFISNHTYLSEAGYFDKSAYSKWLLHTWSLSVEWQFYIIFPIILIALKKLLSFEWLKRVFLVATVVSFFVAWYISYSAPLSAFYLLPARVWEMLLGGVAFLYPLQVKTAYKKGMEGFGLGLILVGYLLVTNSDMWPGYMALLPVLGAYLVIQSNRQDSFFTNNVVFQAVGKWSYSIYLWHWPVVVLGVYFSIDHWWLLGLPLSVLLGYLSYRFVESYKLPSFRSWRSVLKVKPLWMFLSVGILGAAVFNTNGFFFHYPKALQAIGNESYEVEARSKDCHTINGNLRECRIGEGEVQAIVIGDSHSQRMLNTIDALFASKGAVLDWTLDACPTLQGVSRFRQREWTDACGRQVNEAIERARTVNGGVPIFIVNRTSYYLHGTIEPDRMNPETILVKWQGDVYRPSSSPDMKQKLARGFVDTACTFAQSNPVIMFRDTPEFPYDVPGMMQKQLFLTGQHPNLTITRGFFEERNRLSDFIHSQARQECGVKVLDLTSAFCDDQYCYSERDGKTLYSDANHLTPYGADLALPLMQKQLEAIGMFSGQSGKKE